MIMKELQRRADALSAEETEETSVGSIPEPAVIAKE
jgi:hypothetical protein